MSLFRKNLVRVIGGDKVVCIKEYSGITCGRVYVVRQYWEGLITIINDYGSVSAYKINKFELLVNRRNSVIGSIIG